MKSFIFAAAALVAAVAADSIGSAIVVNKCDYDVYLYNTPSSGGGYSEVDEVLSADGTYTQKWTELSNGNGWSIKLSNSTDLSEILQYEYTFHDDGIIWYDLSEVNGNPWNGDWEITADSSTCVPKQSAYRYATDDAYGMQSCPDDATITVTLCSGESDDGSSSASSSVSAATQSTSAATQSASAASTTKAAPSTVSATPSSTQAASSTTLQTSIITSAAASSSESVSYVTTVTKVATTTTWTHHWGPPSKRDTRHNHHHAARHPHARN